MILKAYFELLTNDAKASRQTINQLPNSGVSNNFINNIKGKLALKDRNFKEAIVNFTSVYGARPTGSNAMQLARAFKFNNQQADAINLLEEYILIQQQDHRIRLFLAELYASFDYKKAIEHFEILHKNLENNVMILNNLAWLELQILNLKKGIYYAEQAFQLAPKDNNLLDTYSTLLIEAKEFKKAIIILESAIQYKEVVDAIYINLAKAYIAVGQKTKLDDLLKAINSQSAKDRIEQLL